MKSRNLLLAAGVAMGLGATASTVLARTVVTGIDADTLRVISYQGKPPYKRMIIDRASHPTLYAHYAEMIDYDPQPLQVVERRGAPGKTTPRQVRVVGGDAQEVAEFARFEETGDTDADNNRRWRGAPGKSRLLTR